ncbi:hypothetical protein ECTOBSL9_1364 [Ectothiorhodospira sp. BSL-9]|nr:hypothetical protein ECTOBSL9_1364 [Ectothiorhodospira sp. BSL-9]
MRRSFAVLALLYCGVAAGQEPDPLSLDFRSALQRLVTVNETLQASRATVEQRRAESAEADARRLPTVELKSRYSHLNAPLEADIGRVSDALIEGFGQAGLGFPLPDLPRHYHIQDRDFVNVSLQAVQPVYLGGRIQAGREAARFGLEASKAAVDRYSGELEVALVERFFGQALARESLEVHKRSAESLRLHEFNARRMETEGQIARVERLRASVALAEADNELLVAREQLELSRAALAALLASDRPVTTATPIPAPPPPVDRDAWKAAAEDGNPALREAAQRLQQARAGARATRGEFLPVVSLFGARALYTEDLTLVDPEWVVGLQANWTLFDGGQRRARMAQAEARVSEVDRRLAAGQRDVALLIDQQVDRLNGALARQRTLAATSELTDESLRAQQRAFEEGFATSMDVIDAELARSRVALGELAARHDAWVATAALYTAVGRGEQLVNLIEQRAND